jgi:hypothetical protein
MLQRDPTLIAVVSALVGFVGKSLWDIYWRRHEQAIALASQKRIEFLERQLSQFYWPIYTLLLKNNAMWDQYSAAPGPRGAALKKKIDDQICRTFYLPNHQAILTVIENQMHLAQADENLTKLIQQFIKHATIFQAMRDVDIQDYDPIAVGVPWPQKLFPNIESRLRAAQAEYEYLIGRTRRLTKRSSRGAREQRSKVKRGRVPRSAVSESTSSENHVRSHQQ